MGGSANIRAAGKAFEGRAHAPSEQTGREETDVFEKLLAERQLPQILKMNDGTPVRDIDGWRRRRAEIIEILSREEYGFTPAAPERTEGCVERADPAFAGKAVQSVVRISFDTPGGRFSFPITLLVPVGSRRAPVFLSIAFRPDVPDRYLPAEEIIDHGFAAAVLYYKDITADSGECDGLAAMYPRDEKTGWGKIGMWAFAASRVMDYLETREDVDPARVCVTGHSRLGKTALWCAAQDERFAMAISNDSGSSGAAISRGKVGEDVRAITDRFPYWFCGNYARWAGREQEMPFDQHMLLALIAPRMLYVSSAEEDEWADPVSEFLCCAAAEEVWRVHGEEGLVCANALPAVGEALVKGSVCYHLRAGTHFYSRTDWLYHMQCRETHGI